MFGYQLQQRPAANHCNRLIFSGFAALHAACYPGLKQVRDPAMVLMIASDPVSLSTIYQRYSHAMSQSLVPGRTPVPWPAGVFDTFLIIPAPFP
jgi:hypothetical protein